MREEANSRRVQDSAVEDNLLFILPVLQDMIIETIVGHSVFMP